MRVIAGHGEVILLPRYFILRVSERRRGLSYEKKSCRERREASPHTIIGNGISRRGCCEKNKGAKAATTLGRERFRIP